MHWPQLLLTDGQGAHIQRLSLLVLALRTVEFGQVVEAGGRGRVRWPRLLLPDRQGALVQWLGLLILALRTVEIRKGHCVPGRVQVRCSLLLFTYLVRSR